MPRIAIISDLHVGEVARSPDLNPFAASPVRSDGFLDAFEAFTESSSVSADVLIIPGDISDKAHPNEYQLATTVIKRVADALKVRHDAVFPVLGNHDLNWSLVRAIEGAHEFSRGLRFVPVKDAEWLNSRLVSAGNRTQTEGPYVCVDETDDLYLVRYNSAESDLPDVKPHRGAIQQAHLDALRAMLRDAPPPANKARVFVTHHHPKIYSDPIPDLPDFSALVNAEALLETLHEAKFDLIIHGHKHSPRFTSSNPAGRHALSILCAGSFSRQIETTWTGRITNQFHMIDCGDRDSATGYLRGNVLSWGYQPRQWRPSDSQWAGIAHRLPFGSYPSEAELMTGVRDALSELIAVRAVGWGDLTAAIPGIEFADAALVGNVLKAFSDEIGAIILYNADNPGQLVMVRR